jgi:hypothetical protein
MRPRDEVLTCPYRPSQEDSATHTTSTHHPMAAPGFELFNRQIRSQPSPVPARPPLPSHPRRSWSTGMSLVEVGHPSPPVLCRMVAMWSQFRPMAPDTASGDRPSSPPWSRAPAPLGSLAVGVNVPGSGAEPVDQQSVTQAPVAYRQGLLAQLVHDRPDDARAGKDDLGALGLEADDHAASLGVA